MKKSFLFLVSFFLVKLVAAQSVVMLHSSGTTTAFTGNTAFADAYALAQTGDTLYLSGGGFTASTEIAKGLKIFGAGIHPDSTTATLITQISGIIDIKNGADSLYFEGIQFTHPINMDYTQSANNLSFVRCKFNSTIDFGYGGAPAITRTGYTFIQSVFIDNVDLEGVTNSMITNCIFQSRLYNSNSNTINNCSFLYEGVSYVAINTSNTNVISNCIFHDPNNSAITGTSNTVQNCIFQHGSPFLGTTPVDVNNYKGVALTTVFISVPSNTFSFADNYHLNTTAETTYLGTDGTQVGVYGGVFPLKEGFVPKNPHISSKTIAPQTDNNGMLNININVNAQNE